MKRCNKKCNLPVIDPTSWWWNPLELLADEILSEFDEDFKVILKSFTFQA